MIESDEPSVDDGLTALLTHVRQSRGFDFSGYKRTSLERRIQKRMQDIGLTDYRDYLDELEVNADEFTDLFNTILINVTAFFRDAPAWQYLTDEIVPQLIDSPSDQPIRVWSAACASGEEAYSAAITLAEAMGEDEFRRRVKVYATDVDEEALATARSGTYSSDQLKGVEQDLIDRYFESGPQGRTFRADLRRSVIFGRNNLIQDAPISRIDLLISRNALMYFTPETQARILSNFNFALNESGYLFLGKSEMLITHSELFVPHDLRFRVFRKVPREHLRDRLAFVTTALDGAPERHGELRADALEVSPVAQLVVDRSGFVTLANARARKLLGVAPSDIGRPLQDLDISYQPVDLRSPIQRAYADKKPIKVGPHGWDDGAEGGRVIDIEVVPIETPSGHVVGASIHFDDVTAFARLDAEHGRQKRQLENAYEELQSTVEELETTNEELQSTNEELETTNEELQSTNEELETMNEELQSTNDELETMNAEQQLRSTELDRVNTFLEGILGNLGVGVVVLDHDGRVQVWNASSTELWGLRPEEVEGRDFFALDLGLPVQDLRAPVAHASSDAAVQSETSLKAVNRRGRKITCDVTTLPLTAPGGPRFGVLLLMTHRDDASSPEGH